MRTARLNLRETDRLERRPLLLGCTHVGSSATAGAAFARVEGGGQRGVARCPAYVQPQPRVVAHAHPVEPGPLCRHQRHYRRVGQLDNLGWRHAPLARQCKANGGFAHSPVRYREPVIDDEPEGEGMTGDLFGAFLPRKLEDVIVLGLAPPFLRAGQLAAGHAAHAKLDRGVIVLRHAGEVGAEHLEGDSEGAR
eukprot:scaffold1649_cov134-Isochrysis_galbana.AAC.7